MHNTFIAIFNAAKLHAEVCFPSVTVFTETDRTVAANYGTDRNGRKRHEWSRLTGSQPWRNGHWRIQGLRGPCPPPPQITVLVFMYKKRRDTRTKHKTVR
jgi:hypothetical protein